MNKAGHVVPTEQPENFECVFIGMKTNGEEEEEADGTFGRRGVLY